MDRGLLAKLEMRVKMEEGDRKLGFQNSSVFQGALFEQLEKDYADYLHREGLHPYSMSITSRAEEEAVWTINTLNAEAYENIILKFLDKDVSRLYLKKYNADVKILGKKLETSSAEELFEDFNEKESSGVFALTIHSPMAFKQRGHYVAMPDTRLIYQSLMNKYSSSLESMGFFDEDTLEDMSETSCISGFRIKSLSFPLEGTRISGCVGKIFIKQYGAGTIKRFARYLLTFANFSGIGIKTGMGMGAVTAQEVQI